MKLTALHAVLVLEAILTSALKLSVKQVKRPTLQRRSGFSYSVLAATSNTNTSLDLSTVNDLIYISNVTVGGIVYPVQLDTGSSDLWIKGSTTPLPNSTQTSTTRNLTYGIGWAYGHLSYAEVDFADITVKSQALLDVSSAQNPALGYGADGILGLGFTSLSNIDSLVNGTGNSTGRSLLYNLFEDNPSEPNFIAFALQRSVDSNATLEGSFSIGEYEEKYAAVANEKAIPTWPVTSPKRWNILVDAVLFPGRTVYPTTSVDGVPSNKAVALLDSGTSYSYVSTEIGQAIYGSISGSQYNSDTGEWTVPCGTEIDMALQIGGSIYPIHPLDVSPTSLDDPASCVGSFLSQSVSVSAGEFDWLIGDNALRSVYSIYDFGDFDENHYMGNPYVKLLSLVDPDQASAEFVASRGGTAKTSIIYNAANDSSAPTTVSLSSQVESTLDKIEKYLPALVAVMGLNALVLVAIVIVAAVFLCRRRRKKGPGAIARTPRARMSPMPMNTRNSYIAGSSEPHTYEPVSMAVDDLERMRPMSMNPRDSYAAGIPLVDRQPVSMAITEDDMFTPPSPAFHSGQGSTLRPSDRPNSALYQRQPSMALSENSMFVPPSPPFRTFSGNAGDRPRSAVYHRQTSEDSLIPPSRSFANDRPRSVGFPRQPSQDSLFIPPSNIAPPADRPRSVASHHSQAPEGSPFSSPIVAERTGSPASQHLPPPDSGPPGDRPQSIAY